MEITLIELKATLSQLAAGEASGPFGLLLVVLGMALLVGAVSWIAGAAAQLYGSMRYQDAEKRRKWLEGDE